jgi:hypothetical protein
MRRRRLVAGVGADRLFGVGETIREALDVAAEAVDIFPLRGDGLIEILDHALVVSDADFEFVDAGGVVCHEQVFMTAAAYMLHARP